jgi:hypothetical protein
MAFKKGKVERGARNSAFREALREFNGEIVKAKRRGRQIFFTKDDCRFCYDKWGGYCAYCALPLAVKGQKRANAVHFMLYLPFKAGGQIRRDNVIPVCAKCKEKQQPLPKRPGERIPNVNTVADIVDRLIVEVHKLAWFENKKREEHAKEEPNNDMIAQWDNLSRDCCEMRSILKRDLNAAVAEFVYTLQYAPKKEARTFRPPVVEDRNTIGDIVSDMCMASAEVSVQEDFDPEEEREDVNTELKEELAGTLNEINVTKQYRILREIK